MMARQSKDHEEPLLFDLPLAEPASDPLDPPTPRTPRAPRRHQLLPSPELELGEDVEPPVRSGPVPVPSVRTQPSPAARVTRRSRLLAGLGDLLVHAAVGVTAVGGARLLGVEAQLADWPAIAALLLVFSFLYTVVPLAFWGHTPGMAWAGLTTHNKSGDPLTFDQTFRRWIGGILALATLGVPLLVAPGRRGLSDWLSGSATFPANE
jgi:uncharacterized RDD family membrane protein YckC